MNERFGLLGENSINPGKTERKWLMQNNNVVETHVGFEISRHEIKQIKTTVFPSCYISYLL